MVSGDGVHACQTQFQRPSERDENDHSQKLLNGQAKWTTHARHRRNIEGIGSPLFCLFTSIIFTMYHFTLNSSHLFHLHSIFIFSIAVKWNRDCFWFHLDFFASQRGALFYIFLIAALIFSAGYYSAPIFFTIQRIWIVLGRCLFF